MQATHCIPAASIQAQQDPWLLTGQGGHTCDTLNRHFRSFFKS